MNSWIAVLKSARSSRWPAKSPRWSREFTGMQRVAFTNTGSEAVLAATRVSRTVTGRDKIAVFAGAYHGIFDEVLFRPLTVNGETRTAPIAPGIPGSALEQVIVLEYGNPQSLEILRARGAEIAAVLVEPVQSRRLDLQPREFMHELRQRHRADRLGADLRRSGDRLPRASWRRAGLFRRARGSRDLRQSDRRRTADRRGRRRSRNTWTRWMAANGSTATPRSPKSA